MARYRVTIEFESTDDDTAIEQSKAAFGAFDIRAAHTLLREVQRPWLRSEVLHEWRPNMPRTEG